MAETPARGRRPVRRAERQRASPRDLVAIILAFGIATSINFITLAVMYDAVAEGAELSENATQILVAAFGGIIGILGSYIGFRAGERAKEGDKPPEEPPKP